jgi:hypothetical protein
MSLDFITWSAVALLRTELAQGFLHAPEPDALDHPGVVYRPVVRESPEVLGRDRLDR